MTKPEPSVASVEVIVSLLAEFDAPNPAESFYDRLCDAVCHLTGATRVALLLLEGTRRSVRSVGGATQPAGGEWPLEDCRLVRRSLEQDRVIVCARGLRRELPPAFVDAWGLDRAACAPLLGGTRWFGALLADRGPRSRWTGQDKHTLWMLGRLAALAADARIAAYQQERARQLRERIDLARELHERVIQRLFALQLVTAPGPPLGTEQQALVHDELGTALDELRSALQRPLARESSTPSRPFRAELERLVRAYPQLPVETALDPDLRLPVRLEPLAQSVLREALRNVAKHAAPSRVRVEASARDGILSLEIVNDGAAPSAAPAGMGLRLAAFEAVQHNGAVEFGALDGDRWRVRLVCPLEAA